MIKLVNDTITHDDIDALSDWLKTYPKLTMGPLTKEFEKKWSEWLGVRYSVFVNSGSSANLMMLYTLKYHHKVTKVIVPALSWALEELFKNEKPQVLMLVSVLGLVPNMKEIVDLCNEHNVILLEDVCESMGSRYKNNHLGTFGMMSSFSLYFGHHLSTIEGGMICTDNKEIYDLLLMIRSHGWSRDLEADERRGLKWMWDVDDFSELYTFYVPGFNLRSTDLQAFIGLRQLEKIEIISDKRNENFKLYQKILGEQGMWTPTVDKNNFISNFAYPVMSEDKENIIKRLQDNKIEVRPLIAGSMGTQPFYIDYDREIKLPRASIVDKLGFYIPNHPGLSVKDIEKICEEIK